MPGGGIFKPGGGILIPAGGIPTPGGGICMPAGGIPGGGIPIPGGGMLTITNTVKARQVSYINICVDDLLSLLTMSEGSSISLKNM